jgi:hypothetical protein
MLGVLSFPFMQMLLLFRRGRVIILFFTFILFDTAFVAFDAIFGV